jgi:predicted ribosome quality control (RQC) complex YloA/Tae2 family protein
MRLDSYSLQKLVASLPLAGNRIVCITQAEEIPRLTLFLGSGDAIDFYLQPPLTTLLFRSKLTPPKHPKPIPAIWMELRGKVITSVQTVIGSRIVILKLDRDNGYTLVAELYGKLPRVVLLAGDKAVAAFPAKSCKLNYSIPHQPPLSSLPEKAPAGWLQESLSSWAKDMAAEYAPGSPLLFEQARLRLNAMPDPSWQDFLTAVAELKDRDEPHAALAPAANKHSTFAPYPLLESADWQVFPCNSLAEAAYIAWQHDRELWQQKQAQSEQLAKLQAELKRTENAIARVETDLADYAREEQWRHEAEALLIWGEDSRGHTTVRLPDPYTGREIEIKLDPAHTPHEEAEIRFAKARKAARALPLAQKRLARLQEQRMILLEKIAAVKSGEQPAEPATPTVKKPSASKPIKSVRKKPSAAREFISSDGLTILVGKGDVENEEVTFRLGRSNDLWLHVRGREGSHVIVKVGKEGNVPPNTLAEAAALAAYFSKARQEKAVEVIYTRRKYVTRRKGMPRGSVIVTQEKVFYARPGLPPGARPEA